MKKVAIIALTENGINLGNKISSLVTNVSRYTIRKFEKEGWNNQFNSLKTLISKIFYDYHGLILIMATGIAVRMVAPLLKDKTEDPAVVVMDEKNRYAISLVSGHLGGANELAKELAGLTGCQPIITTATDLNNLTGIDVLARKWQFKIEPHKRIKIFNEGLLRGNKYKFWVDEFIKLPENIKIAGKIKAFYPNPNDLHVLITNKIFPYSEKNIIFLRPPNLIVGVGCKKNYPKEKLFELVQDFLIKHSLSIKSVSALGTIDIKQEEKAILYLKEKLNIPLYFYTKSQLNSCIKNNNLEKSDFVNKTIGAGGVCEPSALLTANSNKLLVKKTKINGVTLAIAQKDVDVTSNINKWFLEV